MFPWSVCAGGERLSGGNKLGGQWRAAQCRREMTVDSLIIKVNIFPNPNLTFRTNLTSFISSWNNDKFFTSWFLFLNLLIASFASLSALPGNSILRIQLWQARVSHYQLHFSKVIGHGNKELLAASPSKSPFSCAETSVCTDDNT